MMLRKGSSGQETEDKRHMPLLNVPMRIEA